MLTQTASAASAAIQQAAQFQVTNGRAAYLERLRLFVASHGNTAWIENDSVFFETQVSFADGTVGTETDEASNFTEARELLGY